MSKSRVNRIAPYLVVGAVIISSPVLADETLKFGFGVEPTAEEIAGWDIDIRPDGQGLPSGSGTYEEGEEIYAEQCAVCHGDFADGGGSRFPALVGGSPDDLSQAANPGQPEKTIGSYWPYASTVFDYIKRAMPFGYAQSLTDDQVYALTGFLLAENDLHDADLPMDAAALKAVRMPNEGGFFMDPRPDVRAKHCMENCYGSVDITSKATLGVTPSSDEESLR